MENQAVPAASEREQGRVYTNRVFAFAAERNFTFSGLIMAGYGIGLGILIKDTASMSPGTKIIQYLIFVALAFLTACNFLISNYLIGLGEGQKLAKEGDIPMEKLPAAVRYAFSQYPSTFRRIGSCIIDLMENEAVPEDILRDSASRWIFRSGRLYLLLLGFILLQMMLIGVSFTILLFFSDPK